MDSSWMVWYYGTIQTILVLYHTSHHTIHHILYGMVLYHTRLVPDNTIPCCTLYRIVPCSLPCCKESDPPGNKITIETGLTVHGWGVDVRRSGDVSSFLVLVLSETIRSSTERDAFALLRPSFLAIKRASSSPVPSVDHRL